MYRSLLGEENVREHSVFQLSTRSRRFLLFLAQQKQTVLSRNFGPSRNQTELKLRIRERFCLPNTPMWVDWAQKTLQFMHHFSDRSSKPQTQLGSVILKLLVQLHTIDHKITQTKICVPSCYLIAWFSKGWQTWKRHRT